MHVAQAALLPGRRGPIGVRYAHLGSVAYVVASVPPGMSPCGSNSCRLSHWGMVLDGSLAIEQGGTRTELPARSVFHVAGGRAAHRMLALGSVEVASFEPPTDRARFEPPDGEPSSDGATRDRVGGGRGWHSSRPARSHAQTPVQAFGVSARADLEDGMIAATGMTMGELVFTAASLGSRTGYTDDWCDLPHWGIVASGSIAIEWERDIEVVSAGEVYACPPGPPGHRFQAADPAAILDFTPIAAIRSASRVIEWRRDLLASSHRIRRAPGLIRLR